MAFKNNLKHKKLNIRRDDIVKVISGKEAGKTGKVLKVLPKKNRVVVEKLNMVKRHQRPGPHSRQGGIIEKEGPIQISNLMVVCPKCTDPSPMGRRVLEDGTRMRFCKKCDEVIDS